MLKYFLLGSIFLIELVCVCARRWSDNEKLHSKGHNRTKWFAQFVFAHVALQLPLTLALSGFFFWARAIHFFWSGTLIRNFLWVAGLTPLLTLAYMPGFSPIWIYGTIATEMAISAVGLCLRRCNSREFELLSWGHLFFLFILAPLAIFASFDTGVTVGLFVLYLRMRIPWGMGEDSIVCSDVFEALQSNHTARLYLAKIDPGIRDIYDSLERDCVQVNQGKLACPMPSSSYKGALEYINIAYREHDIHGTRNDLIIYIHEHYDSKLLLKTVRSFFFPAFNKGHLDVLPRNCSSSSRSGSGNDSNIELEESSDERDSILDMATESYGNLSSDNTEKSNSNSNSCSSNEDEEIIYATLTDFGEQQ